MSLFEQIKKDKMDAFKSGAEVTKNLLGTLLGDAAREDKNPSDEKVFATIRKFISGIDETVAAIKAKSDAFSQINLLEFERHILQGYLIRYQPVQFTEEELEDKILHAVTIQHADLTMKSIMTYFKNNFAGRYDGKSLNKVVTDIIGPPVKPRFATGARTPGVITNQ